MTVMPGFIDAHRHPIQGNAAEWLEKDAADQMRGFLEAGFTTVLSAITPDEGLELRKRIESGVIKGPRVFAARLTARACGGRWTRKRRRTRHQVPGVRHRLPRRHGVIAVKQGLDTLPPR